MSNKPEDLLCPDMYDVVPVTLPSKDLANHTCGSSMTLKIVSLL